MRSFCMIVLLVLAGCGGGDDPEQFIGPPDCLAKPEMCR